ncbi:Rrf2 family transcriptional regulator [Streptococcus merionis]|uniref:Rrf2 family transcriptional regulator n=1 Tax=Streptococcus merionis TaxID=400065 RepID=UPI003514E488
MKQSVQFSDSIHILAYLALYDQPDDLKSSVIAGSVNTNPSNVRKIIGQLRRAGLVTSQQGKVSPQVAKSLSDISLLDVFKSLDKDNQVLMVDKNTNFDCQVGANIQGVLTDYYDHIQSVVEKELALISLADIVHNLQERIKQP